MDIDLEDDLPREGVLANLMKQIKEFGDNFDVDISSLLMEYLHDLERIAINFNDGELNVNFAEAALVIQATTTVYSKKVEALYKLVSTVLSRLGVNEEDLPDSQDGTKKRRRKSSILLAEKERDQFLLLDDIIQVAKSTALKAETLEESQGLRERAPLSILAGRSGTSETSGAFKMMSCDIDSSGAFLLEKMRQRPILTLSADDEEDETDDCSDLHFDDSRSCDSALDAHTTVQSNSNQPEDTATGDHSNETYTDGNEMDYDDYNDDDDAGDLYGGNGDHADGNDEQEEESNAEDPWARLDPHEEDDANEKNPISVGKTWVVPKVLTKKSNNSVSAKGVRLSNLLVSIAIHPSLCGKIPQKSFVVLYPEFKEYASQLRRKARKTQEALRRRNRREKHAPQVSFEEMEDEEDQLTREILDKEGFSGSNTNVANDEAYDDDNDDGQDFYHDSTGFDDSWDGPDQSEAFVSQSKFGLDEKTVEKPALDSYVDMVKVHLQRYLESANQWASESNLHAKVRKWEERIEPFLEEQSNRPPFDIHDYGGRILSGLAVERAHDDEIEEEDALDNENSTKTDRHGHHLHEVPFEELTSLFRSLSAQQGDGQSRDSTQADDIYNDFTEPNQDIKVENDRPLDQYEVCRMFLASLQLANDRNVELVHEDNTAPLRLKLIDSVLANKKLEGYNAPSKQNQLPLNDPNSDSENVEVQGSRRNKKQKTSKGSKRGSSKGKRIESLVAPEIENIGS